LFFTLSHNNYTMSKRRADLSEDSSVALKSGERPAQENGEALEFEDEYEDEFESEDEIYEAGVDGRPDAEREAEEREGL
jgi:ribosome assembly protein RRB1